MRVAVAGGGVFGVTAAVELARAGHDVEVFEKEPDILAAASGINQYRLHRGYHYPRSATTARSSKASEASFRELFGPAVLDNASHYYGISRRDSLTSAEAFMRFCQDLGLEHEVAWPAIVRRGPVETCLQVREGLFDPDALRRLCWTYLRASGVVVRLSTRADMDMLSSFDFRVVATYALLNETLGATLHAPPAYQFEVCEKPVVRLSGIWRDHSIVIMDGPFMCVDPLGTTGLSVMGNVVHAIHHTNVGATPEIPDELQAVMNRGVVRRPPVSNIERFLETADEFLVGMGDAEHVGSMFTVRTVLPHTDATDDRPTLVRRVDERTVSLFSGKIGTCVQAARDVRRHVELLEGDEQPVR